MNFDTEFAAKLILLLPWLVAWLIAWVAGEWCHQWLHLPRITIYIIIGCLLAGTQLLANDITIVILFLAQIALGLLLFELGYRINLRWWYLNPWGAIAGLVEASCTFLAIYMLAQYYDLEPLQSLFLGGISIMTSPITMLRIVSEQHSSGQITDRILHLSAFNSVLAVLICYTAYGYQLFDSTTHISPTIYFWINPLCAIGLGIIFGWSTSVLPIGLKHSARHNTAIFLFAIIFLVVLAHSLQLSLVLASLTCGIVARHRRHISNHTQAHFGTLHDLLSVILFVFIASVVTWGNILSGINFALLFIAIRSTTKIAGITVFARISGITWQKGLLTGIAIMPSTAPLIFILAQTRTIEPLLNLLAPVITATLMLDIVGPILTQYALIKAGESSTDDSI